MDGTVEFGTGFVNGLTIYELPYAGGALALDVLLPDASLSAFEASLTLTSLNAALASVGSPSSAELLLPKFSFKTRLSLEPVLAGMGMPDLFDPEKADLSGMDGARDLSVARVVQQAMIEVDEQGTVAAAATAVDTCDCSAVIEPASVNRPFLFLIRDTKNGSTLFMGRVLDPRSGG
jgi:serpin B